MILEEPWRWEFVSFSVTVKLVKWTKPCGFTWGGGGMVTLRNAQTQLKLKLCLLPGIYHTVWDCLFRVSLEGVLNTKG